MQTTSGSRTPETSERTSSMSLDGDFRPDAFRHYEDAEDVRRLDRLTTTLIDFTVNCLAKQPSDLIDYGIEFFDALRTARVAGGVWDADDGTGQDSGDDVDVMRAASCGRVAAFRRLFGPDATGCDDNDDDDDDDGQQHQTVERCTTTKSDEQRRSLLANVSGVSVFGALDAELMNMVIDAMYERHVRDGDVVIGQDGGGGARFYVVDAGTFDEWIVDADRGQRHLARTYVAGNSFGEVALLYDSPSDVTVTARSEGLLWTLDRRTFRRVMRSHSYPSNNMLG